MILYEDKSPNEYYVEVCKDLMKVGTVISPRGKETRELHPTCVQITNPRERLITSFGRMINLPFALAEVVQIIGGLNDAQALRYYNSGIIDIQGDGPRGTPHWQDGVTRFNAGYGERLRSFNAPAIKAEGVEDVPVRQVDQLDHVIKILQHDPDSRQASIVLSHPWFDHYSRQTKDRACNVYAHAMIRQGRLDWMQVMRSNDIIWGLPYNFCQWLHVMNYVAGRLNVRMGTYTLIQDSLHVYADKYQECREISEFDIYEYVPRPLGMLSYDDKAFENNMVQWEEWIRTGGPTTLVDGQENNYWYQVMCVFNSYAAFKRRRDDLAFDLLPKNIELRWPLLRNYVQWRWHRNGYENVMARVLQEFEEIGRDAESWLNLEKVLS